MRLAILVSLLCVTVVAYAVDIHDSFTPGYGTAAVGLTGGDTVSENTVVVGTTSATKLVVARTDRSRRRICFQNLGAAHIFIGTSSSVSDLVTMVGELTNSAVPPTFCSVSSSQFYAIGSVSEVSVSVYEETQSLP